MNASRLSIKNRNRDILPVKVGKGIRTALIVNLGLSKEAPTSNELELEVKKAKVAVEVGADMIADLSITGDIKRLRNRLMTECDVPIGTVPTYEAQIKALRESGSIVKMKEDELIQTIKEQAEEGVDIMTLHAAMTYELIEHLKHSERIIPIPSRGGSWLAGYMVANQAENPLFSRFDEILDILKEHRVVLSIGSALRPGSVLDGLDGVYMREMNIQGDLVSRALKRGVQVAVEGLGHVQADMIPMWVQLAKTLCHQVPLKPLPIATDIGAGHDHVSGAIAGAIAALYGADVLCCVTRTEHIGLPRLEDVREAVITFKLAAHVADIVKTNDSTNDQKMSEARKERKWKEMWKYALDGKFASRLHTILERNFEDRDYCSMCGKFCAHKIVSEYLEKNED